MAAPTSTLFSATRLVPCGIADSPTLPMTPVQWTIALMLQDAGVRYAVAVKLRPYRLEFHLPDLGIGLEGFGRRKDQTAARDDYLRRAMGLRSILYLSAALFQRDRLAVVRSLVNDVAGGKLPVEKLANHTLVSVRPAGTVAVRYGGAYLVNPWERAQVVGMEALG